MFRFFGKATAEGRFVCGATEKQNDDYCWSLANQGNADAHCYIGFFMTKAYLWRKITLQQFSGIFWQQTRIMNLRLMR